MPTDRRHFTPRPAETWVEVTPLTEDGSVEEPYVFFDRNYEPRTTVPVLKWTAIDWPETADRARIRFWCKYLRTPGKPLHDVMSSGGKIGAVELEAKAAAEDGQFRIHVVERHDAQSRRVDTLRITFESDSRVQPLRVVHEFDNENHLVTHSFYLSPESRAQLGHPVLSNLRVARAEEIKEGALQLPSDGVEVPVDHAGEFLSPTAAGLP